MMTNVGKAIAALTRIYEDKDFFLQWSHQTKSARKRAALNRVAVWYKTVAVIEHDHILLGKDSILAGVRDATKREDTNANI